MTETKRFLTLSLLNLASLLSFAQDNDKIVRDINRYGTFDQWSVREIKESGIIGGATKHLYEFYGSPGDTLRFEGNESRAYRAPDSYLWRTNNVYAKVAGIHKCSVTDFPEKRGDGYCCRIEVRYTEVKVAGLVNMEVVTQGALLVGELPEPIRDTKDPMSKPLYGVEFSGRPVALQYDYKAKVGCPVIKANGFSRKKELGYPDYPEVAILLQKRWEDEDGNVHALRVGTGVHRITEDVDDWENGHRLEVHYGDISQTPYYEDYMQLMNGTVMDLHCINSKGKNMKIIEEGWADADETPNVLIIKILASCEEAFCGGIGNILWIDNVKLIM